MIAQYLAINFPEKIDKLVLVVTTALIPVASPAFTVIFNVEE